MALNKDDIQMQIVRGNLKKAWRCWVRISRVFRAENVLARVNGIFYKASVQVVLLFGSETWCLAPDTLQALEGFRVKATRRTTGMLPKLVEGSWRYLKRWRC